MADIFGRNPEDYQLVRDLRESGTWDAYQRHAAAIRPQATSGIHNFDALGISRHAAVSDAQAVGYLTDNLLALQTFVDNVLYTKFRLPEMIQVNDTVPEGAKTYGYRVINRTGKAERISSQGDDAPTALVSETIVTHPLYYYGIDAIWTIDELRGALLAGTPIDTESLDAAISGTLDTMEELAFTGDEEYKGLFNFPTSGDNKVTRNDASKTFATSTAAEIRSSINNELSALIEDTNETIREFNNATIYLPGAKYDSLSDVYIGDNADKTLMSSILTDNPFTHFTGQPIAFRRALELKEILDAAVNGSTDRMVVTMRHNRIVEMPVSISPRVITILDKGRKQCAQVEAKFGPCWARRASLVRYTDGI